MVRYIPFGYEIFDGEIKIIEREAEVCLLYTSCVASMLSNLVEFYIN